MQPRSVKYLPILFLFLFSSLFCIGCDDSDSAESDLKKGKPVTYDMGISVPMGGNTWITNNPNENHNMITDAGLANWSDGNNNIRTFFRVEQAGEINIGIRAKVPSGQSKLKFTFKGETRELSVNNRNYQNLYVGTFTIEQPGYHYVDMQGVEKSGANFAEVSDVLIGGQATEGSVYYVKDDFYWGRRGPSVHLGYEIPAEAGSIQYFYNEVTVPEGEDVLGSYFMANGFGEGYFGIQVNSETERRILFSVWSPYQTDDPTNIPEEYRIQLLKMGENVNTGEFGNEGAGGQSYRVYNWQAGTTYRFLLKGEPSENNSTDYTAWFYAPEIGQWELIASFRRPKTTTYLTSLYSFLENFRTEMGQTSRKAFYTNQWARDLNGTWFELDRAKFTADATARKDARLDYAGGVENGKFFLKNCGFFSDRVPFDTYFSREKSGLEPEINLSELP